PVLARIVPVEEGRELEQIAAVCGYGVGTELPAVLEDAEPGEEVLGRRHGATCSGRTAVSSQCAKSRRARSTRRSRRAVLSRTCSASGARSPKFEFIGWNRAGSAVRR